MMGEETFGYIRKVSKVARSAEILVIIAAAIKRRKVSKVSLGARRERGRRKEWEGWDFSKKVL